LITDVQEGEDIHAEKTVKETIEKYGFDTNFSINTFGLLNHAS